MQRKNSVLGRPLPDASIPRNGFDRSFTSKVNWSAGMLLPVFCKFGLKGSHNRINRRVFMRTADVNTAAFERMDTHIDFFAVPIRYLWSHYDNFYLNINDTNSSALIFDPEQYQIGSANLSIPTQVPSFNLNLPSEPDWMQDTYLIEDGTPFRLGAIRLLDMLGYGGDIYFNSGSMSQQVNALPLLAYQKIYYDHYRNTAYENNNPYAYNADFLYIKDQAPTYGSDDLANLLHLRFINYRNDYYNNLYPSLDYSVSTPNGSDWSIPGSVVGAGSNTTVIRGLVAPSNSGATITFSGFPNRTTNIAVGAQSLRALFALDKLLRASAYAPKHVKNQYEARFGIKFPDYVGMESQRLGSFMNDVVIGEVTATSNSQSEAGFQPLGTIGGKGVGSAQFEKDIEFNLAEDSIIMGIMYTIPRSSYDSNFIEKFNLRQTRNDFFQPEFMNLGLQPMYRKEFVFRNNTEINNTILGYTERYIEDKLSVDVNHGLFRKNGALSVFTSHSNATQREGNPTTNGVSYSYFKVKPSDLNSIFMSAYDGEQLNDQFYGYFEFKFFANQNMSVQIRVSK